jgi:hypothetical protein
VRCRPSGFDAVFNLFQDVADALVGSGQGSGFRQGREGAHGGQALGNVAEALRPLADHGIDFLRRVTLLAQAAGQAVVNEIGKCGFGGLKPSTVENAWVAAVNSSLSGKSRSPSAEHADDAQRVAAQREGVAVAGRNLADAEHADQGFQLVGQRDDGADLPRGRLSPAKRGL